MGLTLEERLSRDLKEAIKNRDAIKTSTIRMVKAAIEKLAIEKRIEKLEDSDVIRLITKQIKQHGDSIEGFQKGNRLDLVEKEKNELEILKSYIPQETPREEIAMIVQKKINDLGAPSPQDFSKVMKSVMEELKGKVDGKRVSQIVNELLSKRSV